MKKPKSYRVYSLIIVELSRNFKSEGEKKKDHLSELRNHIGKNSIPTYKKVLSKLGLKSNLLNYKRNQGSLPDRSTANFILNV